MAGEGDRQGLRGPGYNPPFLLPCHCPQSLPLRLPTQIDDWPRAPLCSGESENHSLKAGRKFEGHSAQLLMLQNLLRDDPCQLVLASLKHWGAVSFSRQPGSSTIKPFPFPP